MLAMSYQGPYRVRLVEKPEPKIEHPQDAIVRVTRACVCGSDLHLYHGLVPDTRVGTTFGHEFVGIVEEIGPDVHKLKVGDRVLVPFNIACGQCYFCQKGLFGNCHNANPNASAVGAIYGYSHTTGGYHGGQAEYVRVPYADVGPYVVPDDIDDDNAVLCTDVFPTGYQAAEMGEIKQGDTVVVFGAGPVGLFAAKSAWLLGAGRVIVVDREDYRLEFAKKFAACETINYMQVDDIIQTLKEQTDYLGADVCIDAVGAEAKGSPLHYVTGVRMKLQAGAPTAVEWCINAVRKGGVVSVVGVYGPTGNIIPLGNVVNKGLTIRGNQASVKRNLPRLIEHIQAGRINPKDIVTHRIPLEDVAEAYHMFSSKLDGCIKPILIPPRATH